MSNVIKKFESRLALDKASRGEDTGPVSRILSGVNILILVYLLVSLFKDEKYISAVVLLTLGFTRFGSWVSIGLAIYFVVVGYWTGVILMLLFGCVGWFSIWFGTRNIKRNLYSGRAKVDPFEGMFERFYILVFQVVFFVVALLVPGMVGIIFWVLFGIVTLLQVGGYWHRLSSPWRRLHLPLMVRYAGIAGYQTGIAERTEKEVNIDEALHAFAKNVYPDLADDDVDSILESVQEKYDKFVDRKILEDEFRRKNASVDPKKLEELLDKIGETLKDPKETGLKIRWFIAEIIEHDYGIRERAKYLREVIIGGAN